MFMDKYHLSSTPMPVAQLVRESDYNSKDPASNPGSISMSFYSAMTAHVYTQIISLYPAFTVWN